MAIPTRPIPPEEVVLELERPVFEPAPDLIDWARSTFIDEDATLANPDHWHLRMARLAALWTNVENGRAGRQVVGQCEQGLPLGNAWRKGRMEYQLIEWFGGVPDFLLTFDASYALNCSDAEFCALVEHELYHCGVERDVFGAPKFRKSTGLPAFKLRGHDVEEFVGVVRRYGADAAHVRKMVDAANEGPEIASVKIKQACGTCQLRVA